MVLLVVAEFSAYLSVTTESKVVLDHFDSSVEDTLQVLTHFGTAECLDASMQCANAWICMCTA
jgi:hypothetical protein